MQNEQIKTFDEFETARLIEMSNWLKINYYETIMKLLKYGSKRKWLERSFGMFGITGVKCDDIKSNDIDIEWIENYLSYSNP